MSDFAREFDRLMEEADDLEYGPAPVALFEEAVRLADAHNDVERGFTARLALSHVARFGGRPEVLLVAFTWCLAQSDRDPERFPAHHPDWRRNLLFRYKWVTAVLPSFPQISRDRIAEALDDMERRYRQAGASLHAVCQIRRHVAASLGDREAGRQAHARAGRARRDWLSDCVACEADRVVRYWLFCGRDELAVRKAADLRAGRLSCTEVPHRTHAQLVVPLLRLGRPAEAMDCHLKGYRLVARNPQLLASAAEHLLFLALTDNADRAAPLVAKHLPAALAADPRSQFALYRAARFVLERLAERGKGSLKLRLPPAFPLYQPAGRYAVADLARWFAGQADDLAARFDARNGNDYHRRQVAELDTLTKLITPHPLPARGRAGKEAVEA